MQKLVVAICALAGCATLQKPRVDWDGTPIKRVQAETAKHVAFSIEIFESMQKNPAVDLVVFEPASNRPGDTPSIVVDDALPVSAEAYESGLEYREETIIKQRILENGWWFAVERSKPNADGTTSKYYVMLAQIGPFFCEGYVDDYHRQFHHVARMCLSIAPR